MALLDKLAQNAEAIGRRTWRLKLEEETLVAKAFRRPEEPFDARLVRLENAAFWRDFAAISDDERGVLELGAGDWFVALRPWVRGSPMVEKAQRAQSSWRNWGERIACAIRDLHAQQGVHGDLRPKRIIVDRWGPTIIGLSPCGPSTVEGTSTPFRAPELVDGTVADRPADIYALGALLCWMAAGGELDAADEAPSVPDAIDDEVADLIRRAFHDSPEVRPSAARIAGALADPQKPKKATFAVLPPGLYRGMEQEIYEALQSAAPAALLEGVEKTGKTYALQRLADRFRIAGQRAIYASPAKVEGPGIRQVVETSLDRGPWEPLRRLIAALRGADEISDAMRRELSEVTGDEFHVFDVWSRRLDEALSPGDTVVLWDDLDRTSPDVRAFWAHYLSRQKGNGGPGDRRLLFAAASAPPVDWFGDARRFEFVGPDASSWLSWRNRTQVEQARQVADDDWKRLVETSGDRPVELFEAINRACGHEKPPEFAAVDPVPSAIPEASVLFAGDWRRHLAELANRGAYRQIIVTSKRLYEVLLRAGRAERIEVLDHWLEALLRTECNAGDIEEIDQALEDNADTSGPGADAHLLRARLYAELRRHGEAIDELDSLESVDNRREIQRRLWKAHIFLAAGKVDDATQLAASGKKLLDRIDRPMPAAALHLEVIAVGARALGGDAEAIDELRRLAARVADEELPATLPARCHVLRASGLLQRGADSEATDAYLRAVEELESAGLKGRLPPVLLDLGMAFVRRGHLGVAREYLARGEELIHGGTRPATAVLLLINTAGIDALVGRVDRAQRFADRARAFLESAELQLLRSRFRAVVGDIAYRRGHFDAAVDAYRQGMAEAREKTKRTAALLLRAADASLAAGKLSEAGDFLDRARRLIDEGEFESLECEHGVLRARRDRFDEASLNTVAADERLERFLTEAIDERRVAFGLRQTARLWEELPTEDRDIRRTVAELHHRARRRAASGLSAKHRRQLFSEMTLIPAPGEIESDAAKKRLIEKSRGEDRQKLVAENERLRDELDEARRHIDELETRCKELEERLRNRPENPGASKGETRGRGRRPKATRDEVVEALESHGGDYAEAADSLGVSKRTLYRYVNRYDIDEL